MIYRLSGDLTGSIHARDNHTWSISTDAKFDVIIKPPVNIWIDKQATVYLARTTDIIGMKI